MFVYRPLHLINDYITIVLSFLFNFVLIILIKTKSPAILKPYSKLMLLNIFFDLALTVTMFIIKIEIDIDDMKIFFILSGVVTFMPQPWAFVLIIFYWFVFLYVCVINKPVPYLYRYLVICRQLTLNFLTILKLYAIAIIVALSAIILPILALSKNIFDQQYIDMLQEDDQNWTIDGVLPSFAIANAYEDLVPLMFGYMGITIVLSYLIICFFAWKIFKKLSSYNALNVKKIQNQISFVLFIQTIIPMLVTCTPLVVMMIGMMSEGHFWHLGGLVLIMSFSWIPILNPLMTILLISAYRKAIKVHITRYIGNKTEIQIISNVARNQTSKNFVRST